MSGSAVATVPQVIAGNVVEGVTTELSLPSLQDHLAQLDSFLTSHTASLTTLRNHLLSGISNVQSSPLPTEEGTSDQETQNTAIPAVSTADAHLCDLQLFLHKHLENVQVLHQSFDTPIPDPVLSTPVPGESKRYKTLADQFTVILLTATFTGGVLIAFMSLMNDLLSAQHSRLFLGQEIVTRYSMGVVLGLMALGLNLSVAVLAGVNATLATYYATHTNKENTNLHSRICLCVCGQFVAAILTGLSLVLLSFEFGGIVATFGGAFYLAAMLLSIYQMQKPWDWKKGLYANPLAIPSIIFSTIAFGVAVATINADSLVIIPAYVLTLLYHILATVRFEFLPAARSITSVLCLAIVWAVGLIITLARLRESRVGILQVTCASIEVVILAAIVIKIWREGRQETARSPV